MRITYRRASRDDLIRQFRYYLVARDAPGIAIRFRDAVRATVAAIAERPLIAPRSLLRHPALTELRSWPVTGFPAIRIYFLPRESSLEIVRILHGKQDVRAILEREPPADG